VVAGGAAFELRPVGLHDAPWVADIFTRSRPSEPVDAEVLRHQWATMQLAWFRERSAVWSRGRPAGFADVWHAPWAAEPDRVGRWFLRLVPGSEHLAASVVDGLEQRLRDEQARKLSAGCYEDETWLRSALEQAGYLLDHVDKQWELDLVANRDLVLRTAGQSRAAMSGQGLRLATLAEVRDQPGFWPRMAGFYTEVDQDIPRSTPYHPLSPDEVRSELSAPDVLAERVWLALAGDDIAGLSYLTYPPGRGNCWTGMTGTARAYRGRGVARAVKMETMAQAIGLGVSRVRTENDERNEAILHINETLGYVPIPGWVNFLKDL
jgi:mycothiol synthase